MRVRETFRVCGILLAAGAAALVGCTGTIDEGTTGPGGPGGGPGGGPEAPAEGTDCPGCERADTPSGPCAEAGPARLWRLSHAQYDRTVRDLLGTDARPGDGFEAEASGTGFRNGSDVGFVSTSLAEQYMRAAEALSAEAVADPGALLPCEPADPADRECIRDFIAQFGKRAFRRPLREEERELFFELYGEGAASSPALGMQMVIEAMIQSPQFLYRFELGQPGDSGEVVGLTQHELATLVAYLVWDTMPDDRLLAKADDGVLAEPDVLRAEVRRMLEDPRAEDLFSDFFAQYLGLESIPTIDKDEDAFPEFTPSVANALVDEANAFIGHVVWERDGTLAHLLTADYSFVDAELADYYGVEAAGDGMHRTSFPPEQRSGLLTHAGFLATLASRDSSSPTFRGHFVRTKLLCHELPDPPPDVDDEIDPPDDVQTTRERYQAHLVNPSCNSCHQYMDSIGFGFEHFDASGRYRETENGVAIDARGEILEADGIEGAFEGADELAERLASSREVSDCVARHFFRYALGRLERDMDACTVERLQAHFSEEDTRLLALLDGIVTSDLFRYRVKD